MPGHKFPQFTFSLAEGMALHLAKQLGKRLSGISYLSAAANTFDEILASLPHTHRQQLEQEGLCF
jgi:predicted DNA-binding transcriptional regulator YafY|tara:strand:+ start:849 stop:1043 length:195 start_codon:yes stop_codon:yes gene_type:complete